MPFGNSIQRRRTTNWKGFGRLWWLGFCLWIAGGACAESNRLNLFIWSDYIDPAIVKQFEKQFDCKVTIDVYEDAESMLARPCGTKTFPT